MRGSRRGGVKTEHLMEIPSKALIADGMLDGQGGPNFPRSGGVSPVSSALNGDFKGAVYNLKQNIPLIGKDPAHANNRATVGVGVVASPKTWRMASKIPVVGGIVRGIRRTLTIKDGRKRVALVG